jgi:hypothetical protein
MANPAAAAQPNTAIDVLSRDLFAVSTALPPTTGGQGVLVSIAPKFYVLPASANDRVKLVYMAFLCLSLTNASISAISVEIVFFSLMATAISPLQTAMDNWGFEKVVLSDQFLLAVDAYIAAATTSIKVADKTWFVPLGGNLAAVQTDTEPVVTAKQTMRQVFSKLDEGKQLGGLKQVNVECIMKLASELPIYGLVGVLYFFAAKGAARMVSVSLTSRLRAVSSKYSLSGVPIYSGTPQFPLTSAMAISRVWAMYPAFRKRAFTEAVSFEGMQSSPAAGAITTNTHLLDKAGMSHVVFIAKLFQTHPWLASWRRIAPSVDHFRTSCRLFSALPTAEKRFYKVSAGDAAPLFLRKELEPLIAVARLVEIRSQPTVSEYFSNDAFADLITRFETLEQDVNRGVVIDWATRP